MRKIILVTALVCMAFTAPSALQASTPRKSVYVSKQEQADQLYAGGKYTEAFRNYLPLAKQGDSFSQYRVSYMYLEGQGHESDIVEAFAWSYLAAQNKSDPLIDYRDTVSAMVPKDQQNKALRKIDYYMRKWGNRQLASDMITQTKRELNDCTGSRLGTRCEEVYAAQMPRFWGINPGNGSEAESVGGSNTQSGSRSSAIGMQPGAPSRDVAYYQGLRQRINELNRYIGENSGNVELGEFKVVEDEPKTPTSEESAQ
ncbi:MAG: SEL1-like repeat protein [Xanthomonadales bacterium]|nr:SEL1-like repeat protein [Xanthomonadales bacterium]